MTHLRGHGLLAIQVGIHALVQVAIHGTGVHLRRHRVAHRHGVLHLSQGLLLHVWRHRVAHLLLLRWPHVGIMVHGSELVLIRKGSLAIYIVVLLRIVIAGKR